MSRASRHVLSSIAACAAALAVAPVAGAAISPTITLDQSAGHQAGATQNLGLDLKFAPTGSDSPHHLTINLPPGLLANASINHGSCLTTAQTSGTACEVGTGTVTANVLGPVPLTLSVTDYLVPPPAPGDLAGLAVMSSGMQLGSTGAITVRPTGDPAGVGVSIALVLPNSVDGVPTSVTEISSTFNSLRYPATCPSTPARVTATADSYSDATPKTVSAPLQVTGCSALSYSPKFSATAARDRTDRQVVLTTDVTQGATESPSSAVSLAFPPATLGPNLSSIQALCTNLASGSCPVVGSATAASPLYPKALTGQAYLTGSPLGLSLTLVFPSPFPLTLTGQVDLVNNAATFSGLPDIPLTSLSVTLSGGPDGLFLSTCRTPSGTAMATLTDANADRTVKLPAQFTVSGCPAVPGGGPGGPISGGGGPAAGAPVVSRPKLSARHHGHPTLSFRIKAKRHRPALRRLTVALPRGLRFVGHRQGRHIRVRGLSLRGARLRSAAISHGRLVIVLRRPVRALTVKIGSRALRESASLSRAAARGHVKRLTLTVTTVDARGHRSRIRAVIRHPRL
ncbi:MAG: hypothetical protein ACRDMX_00850 [Solirubrobacteraceae bacterium]